MHQQAMYKTIGYATASGTAAGSTWVATLSEWMQISASAVAVVAGVLAIITWFKNRNGSGK